VPDQASRPIVVIGSGFAAYGASQRLETAGRTQVVFDKAKMFGGHTATHVLPGGWIFDEGPHVSFTKDERLQALFAENVKDRYESVPILLNNHWNGHWIVHPAQVNLHGLPTDLVVDVLRDFVAAPVVPEGEIRDYDQWCRVAYGETFAETFPLTYGRKYHTTAMDRLTTDWLGPRMYRPTLEEMLRGALAPAPITDVHYVTHFRYPTDGGYSAYLRPWAERVDLRLEHELVGVDPATRVARFANGHDQPYAALISSMPLPDLVPCIDGAPDDVLEAARALAFTTVVLVNIGIDRREGLGNAHISYFYDEDVSFARLSYPHLLSPRAAPDGKGSIQAEVYFSEKYKPVDRPLEAIADQVIADLRRIGVIHDSDSILVRETEVARYANVIYDHDRADALATVHGFLDTVGISVIGRYGEWNHLWTDQAFLSGERVAGAIVDQTS
jgi:protoporphyrinogen oxidase